ncbi:MAG: biotin/lipoyl-binding protein, partial [Pirellulaceae bacterium]|nr:biotin/lipoyl-binding protein [Pirellulaceae bacterium]
SVTLGLTKVVHEFGHGLTCKHFGGECHEMGVMVLVLTPCLYCNVSDSWMLPSKWKRAAIGAAGMYVEVVIASIATYIWWFSMSTSNLLSMICLNVIFISSISTILFNANPLLRYDGYYILADLVEIPNLRQKATSILSRKMGEWFLGIEPPEDPFLPQRNQLFFVVYSIAAAIYRWVVVLSILWFLHQLFKKAGVQVIGHAFMAMSLFGLIVMPIYKVVKYFRVPGRMHKVKKPRMYASLAVLTGIVLFVFRVPLPHSVMSTLEIRPRDAARIYVDVPGTLEEVHVKVGDEVKPGQTLARLKNVDLDLRIARLEGDLAKLDVRERTSRGQGYRSPRALDELLALEESRKMLREQLEQQKIEQQRLVLRAPDVAPGQDPDRPIGIVMPPPWRDERPTVEGQLPSWSRTPLDERNLGAPMDEGDVFCLIGDPSQMEAILYVDQGDVEFVAKGQRVEIKLDELPFETFKSEIVNLAKSKTETVSKRLSTEGGGELATKTDEAGVSRPQSAAFQASVPLDDPDGLLRIGLRGRAKIHTIPQTIAQRVWRMLNQLINFRL